MDLLNKKEALAIMAIHYRSYEILMATAHMDGNVFDVSMYQSKLQDLADQYGTVAGLSTYGDVHKAVNLTN